MTRVLIFFWISSKPIIVMGLFFIRLIFLNLKLSWHTLTWKPSCKFKNVSSRTRKLSLSYFLPTAPNAVFCFQMLSLQRWITFFRVAYYCARLRLRHWFTFHFVHNLVFLPMESNMLLKKLPLINILLSYKFYRIFIVFQTSVKRKFS